MGKQVFSKMAGGSAASFAAGLGIPSLLKAAANRYLKKHPNLRGRIGSLSWNPLTGRVTAGRVSLVAFREELPVASLHAETATVRVSLRDAVQGRLVADIDVDRPAVLWRAPDPPSPTHPPTATVGSRFTASDVHRAVAALPAMRIGRIRVSDGEFHVQNLPGQNGTDLRLQRVDIDAENFVTRPELAPTSVVRVSVTAQAMDSGRLRASALADPLAPLPRFSAEARLEGMQLPELGTMIEKNAGTSVEKGVLNVYAEAAGADGAVRGYVKPVVENLKIDRPARGGGRLKTAMARMVAGLMSSRKGDRIATKISFAGPVERPEVEGSRAVRVLLRNAFGRPLPAGLDGGINPNRVAREVSHGQLLAPAKPPSAVGRVVRLIVESFRAWSADQASRMGAALSYYTVFSMAPLILLAISISGLVFGEAAVEGRIMDQLGGLVGSGPASTIQSMVEAARKPATGVAATIVGIITLIIGASAVMTELKTSLNRIWRAQPIAGIVGAIKKKLITFSAVLVVGFLLLVSLLVSAAISAAANYVGGLLPIPADALQLINLGASIAIITVLFAFLYKILPDADVEWRDVWVGALVTTSLFVLGKHALGIYLGRAAGTSAYGAAGSVLILLAWVYYSAQIFYLGAEFTRVYAEHYGSRSEIDLTRNHSRR